MLLVVKEDEAPDPANVGALGTEAEMFYANNSSDLIQEFGRRHRSEVSFLNRTLSGTIDARWVTPDNTTKSVLAPRTRGIIHSWIASILPTVMASQGKKPQLFIAAIVCGVLLTFTLTVIAFMGRSRAWGCTFVWQACLLQTVIHTPDNPIHEASPIDLFAFLLGILLGVPIYSALCYVALLNWQKPVRLDRNWISSVVVANYVIQQSLAADGAVACFSSNLLRSA